MRKNLIAAMLSIVLLASLIPAAALSLRDIDGHWAEEALQNSPFASVLDDGGKFYPDRAVTRMEFARMLHNALGIQIAYFKATDIKEYFTDVDNEDPGASALYDLVTSGIVSSGGAFRPNDPLRRDEMIHLVIAALKYATNGEYALIKMMPAPFEDDAEIKAEYKNDVIEAVLLKIIFGRGDNRLFPVASATRAESAVVIGRLLQTLKNLANVDVVASASFSDTAIEMKLSITNNTWKAISIRHTSGQKFDFQLLDAKGNSLYTWSADKLFLMAMTETVIQPGESILYTEKLEGDAYTSIKDSIHSVKAEIVGTSDDFQITESGYDYFVE